MDLLPWLLGPNSMVGAARNFMIAEAVFIKIAMY
jgi:hypothetical protein